MSITVCTVSGKGGTGKSTVCSGLAMTAAAGGARVLIIDLDAGFRCLDTIFGIDDRVVFDLADALKEMDIKKALYTSKCYKNIFIIPAPSVKKAIDFNSLCSLIETAKDDYDYIFLDFPAGADFEAYSYFKDAVFLIVTGADAVSPKAAAVISGGLEPNVTARLIINRFDKDMIRAGFYRNIDDIIDTALTRLIGIVPADGELLLISQNHKIKAKGRSAKAFNRIVRRISGEDVFLPDFKKI